jgi:hypothetical protein
MMSRILLRLGAAMTVVFLNPLHSRAATIAAASTAQKDVAAAVASAQDGDTVQIPAGDSTWTSGLTITKAITLQGQGSNNTFLRRSAGLLTLQPTNNKPIRVTGVYFDMSPFADESHGDRSAIWFYGTCTNLRIDHCYFLNGQRPINIRGYGYGVTDHCTFHDNNISIYMGIDSDGGGNASWASPVDPGKIDTMVVEDCKIINDLPSSAYIDAELYGQNGARFCFRHNTVDYSATGVAFVPIDAHGYNTSWGNGTRFYEVYNNTFECQHTYRFCYLRGGTHIFHDNQFIMTGGGSAPNCIALELEKGSTTVPANERVVKSFFWNNTYNGSPAGAADWGLYTGEPVLNVDFFNRPIQSGDSWYPYTPLVYPHPMVTAQDGGKLSPAANLHAIGSGS